MPKRPSRRKARGNSTKLDHNTNFHHVMGIITRALGERPPNTLAHIFADPERLVDLLCGDQIITPKEKEELTKDGAIAGSKGTDVINRFVERYPKKDRLSDLKRLQADRDVIHSFIYRNLGVHRVNVFVSTHDALSLCHSHPFLPASNIIVGPWFGKEKGYRLQRKSSLTGYSERLGLEAPIRKQLWENKDLTVARAFRWLSYDSNGTAHLSKWEKRGDFRCLLISEGYYYFHALERAERFGFPGHPEITDLVGAAQNLGLLRGETGTRRLVQVLNWMTAAYCAELERKNPRALDEFIKEQGFTENQIRTLRGRILRIPPLGTCHPINRCVAVGGGLEVPGVGSETLSDIADPLRTIVSLARFLERWCLPKESLDAFSHRIRPVIDIDVFSTGDFNALLFPLYLRHPDTSQLDLKGIVFVSTTVDFLDNWAKHRTRLEELRAIFTLVGLKNLQIAFESEISRADSIRFIAFLGSTLIKARDGVDSAKKGNSRVLGLLDQQLRTIETEDAVSQLRDLAKRARQIVNNRANTLASHYMEDLEHYGLPGKDVRRSEENARVLADNAWKRACELLTESKRIAKYSPLRFCNYIEHGLMIHVEEGLFRHTLTNIFLNAIEAVYDDPNAEVLIFADELEMAGGSKEVHIRILDTGSTKKGLSLDPLDWFRPGFIGGKNEKERLGFGLATAWKTVARHGGRIWVSRPPGNDETEVSIALPHEKDRAQSNGV